MKKHSDCLLEILTEELPPHHLNQLSTELANAIQQGLREASLTFDSTETFATPRRLAVIIRALTSCQPDQKIERRGPPYDKAFDPNGKPTQVALGFAKSCSTDISQLEKMETDKGCWLAYRSHQQGRSIFDLMPDIVSQAIKKLPIKKLMRWGMHEEEFVRPVHSILLIYGDRVIPAKIFNIDSGNKTLGHRFLCQKPLTIKNPSHYEKTLEKQGHVIASFEKRKQLIEHELHRMASKHHFHAMIDPALLEQVTALVELPVILIGNFSSSFLSVPKEALVLSMQHHQRCFPLTDQKSNLVNHFLIVSNLKSQHPEEVIKGNERVMNARLSDAAYFYQLDQAESLEKQADQLKSVVFQEKLGSLFDKTERLMRLAQYIAERAYPDMNLHTIKRAALLAKADLMTSMVGEFPELQGIMGRYYALSQKELPEIAQAIREHLMPYNAEADLPDSPLGQLLALADRIDTLVGIFGIDKKPTGDKDPFGLRRAAIGMIRLLTIPIPIDLSDLIAFAKANYGPCLTNTKTEEDVMDFIYDRLKHGLIAKGYTAEQFSAIDKKHLNNMTDFIARIEAVQAFCLLPDAKNLAAANKRVCHLLAKESQTSSENTAVHSELLSEIAEINLAKMISEKEKQIDTLVASRKSDYYTTILKALAELREPVDRFFDQVMVMVDDEAVRRNRLTLLRKLRALFLRVADISVL